MNAAFIVTTIAERWNKSLPTSLVVDGTLVKVSGRSHVDPKMQLSMHPTLRAAIGNEFFADPNLTYIPNEALSNQTIAISGHIAVHAGGGITTLSLENDPFSRIIIELDKVSVLLTPHQ
jgi:hypothetical protein